MSSAWDVDQSGRRETRLGSLRSRLGRARPQGWPAAGEGSSWARPDAAPSSREPDRRAGTRTAPGQGAGAPSGSGRGCPAGAASVPVDPSTHRNSMGGAALVLGLLALLFMALLPPLGLIAGLLAVVLGFMGRGRISRGEASNVAQTLGGIATGCVGVVVAAGMLISTSVFVAHHQPEINSLTRCEKQAATTHAHDICTQKFSKALQGRH
ncbi:MAG: DUF4190 domain-containing protein [Acidimicrobiales bacterium]